MKKIESSLIITNLKDATKLINRIRERYDGFELEDCEGVYGEYVMKLNYWYYEEEDED